MKKRIILGLIAGALAVTLSIGGTLMLLTADTEKATNVVTVGKLNGVLREKGGVIINKSDGTTTHAPDYVEDYKTVKNEDPDKWEGIIFDKVVPNQKLDKEPIVSRYDVGGSDAYVKVDVAVRLYDSNGSLVTSPTDFQKRLLSDILGSISGTGRYNIDNWVYENGGYNKGAYYYVESQNGPLARLVAPVDETIPSDTEPIFSKVFIENYNGSGLEEFAQIVGYKVKIELISNLIQAEHNAYDDSNGDEYSVAFDYSSIST